MGLKHFKLVVCALVVFVSEYSACNEKNFVPNLGIEFRSDVEVNRSNDKAKTTNNIAANENGELSSTQVTIPWSRLTLFGKFDDNFSYWFQTIYTSNASTLGAGDAKLIYKINDSWSLEMGKMYLLVNGFEGFPTPEHIYNYTLAARANPIRSKRGARISGEVSKGQKIFFSLTDSKEEKNQSDLMPGLLWLGSFNLDDEMSIKTDVSHFIMKSARQKSSPSGVPDASAKTDTYTTAGVQLVMRPILAEVTYLQNVHRKAVNDKDNEEQSTYLKATYSAIDTLDIIAKFEASAQKVSGKEYMSRSAMEMGIEYFPAGMEGRSIKNYANFHLVYVKIDDEYKVDIAATDKVVGRKKGDKVSSSKIIAGTTLKRW